MHGKNILWGLSNGTHLESFLSSFLLISFIFVLLLSGFLFIPVVSANDFILQNSSNSAQNYFVVNGSFGYVGVGTANPVATLDVNGSVRVGSYIGGCSAAMAGTLRYNATKQMLEYCNATNWSGIPYAVNTSYINITRNITGTATIQATIPITNSVHYSSPGTYSYTVTNGAADVTIKAWGAGGLTQASPSNGQGGGGGFAGGTFYGLHAGDTITVVVGSTMACTYATVSGSTSGEILAGSGGQSGQGTGTGGCGGGGGGAGGGSTGGTGGGSCDGGGGNGGTQGAGGTGGSQSHGACTGGGGSYMSGGSGGCGASNGAGGQGGCGYYGGGGGGGGGNSDGDNNQAGGGGGGGSNYISGASSIVNLQGSGSTPANTGDIDYQSGVAGPGQSGYIVLSVAQTQFVNETVIANVTTTGNFTDQGLFFPDGTIQTTSANSTAVVSYWNTTGGGTQIYYTGGRVGINTTNPFYTLQVNGTVLANAYWYLSDARFKKNVQTLDQPAMLSDILALRPVSYNWKDSGAPQVGLVAQDVERVFPQAVHTTDDGQKSIEYAALVAPLVSAVQEQQKKINELNATIQLIKKKKAEQEAQQSTQIAVGGSE